MALRHKSKAAYYLAKAKKAENRVEAKGFLEEAIAYSNIARKLFSRHHEILRKVRL